MSRTQPSRQQRIDEQILKHNKQQQQRCIYYGTRKAVQSVLVYEYAYQGILMYVRSATRQRPFGRQEIARADVRFAHFTFQYPHLPSVTGRQGHLATLHFVTLYFLCNMNFTTALLYPILLQKKNSFCSRLCTFNSMPGTAESSSQTCALLFVTRYPPETTRPSARSSSQPRCNPINNMPRHFP